MVDQSFLCIIDDIVRNSSRRKSLLQAASPSVEDSSFFSVIDAQTLQLIEEAENNYLQKTSQKTEGELKGGSLDETFMDEAFLDEIQRIEEEALNNLSQK